MNRTVALLVALAVCGSCTRTRPPDIMLVTFDTLRADVLGAYGDEETLTPVFDRFAGESVVFERAYTTVPLTYPSLWSLLHSKRLHDFTYQTSLESRHPEARSFVERLREAGYLTVALSGTSIVSRGRNFGEGFDHFYDTWGLTFDNGVLFKRFLELAAERLDDDRSKPFFLWVHFFDPHSPWGDAPVQHRTYPPEHEHVRALKGYGYDVDSAQGLQRRRALALFLGGTLEGHDEGTPLESLVVPAYRSEVSWSDQIFGKVLRTFDRISGREDAVVILGSDHGIAFGDHSQDFGYAFSLYDEVNRVPLMIRAPGVPPGRVAEAVSLVDVGPTVLHFAGIDDRHADGVSLRPLMNGEAEAERSVYSETVALPEATLESNFSSSSGNRYAAGTDGIHSMLASGTLKLIHIPSRTGGPFELYDLLSDPGERQNLFDERKHAALVEELYRLKASSEKPDAGQTDPEMLERLRALGYIE